MKLLNIWLACLVGIAIGACGQSLFPGSQAQPLDTHTGEPVDACAVHALIYRTTELERKVGGMQHQITVLHAKVRFLSVEIQNIRDQKAGK